MRDFMDKARDFVDKHDKQVDEGIAKAGEEADKRTGGRYRGQIDKGIETAQRRTGRGDTSPR
ncbi:antitoxin [Micromonospora olivasterospora]|uniref:Antitoxin protein of toxin-antitoxin system n=1 Tax=Micromonospora olivasterospora TaxID=1880 RepID=A0A562IAQ3_MICOL|nr:antitoxin [Micromonospora olivasterospora]TWH68061.1 antitoxin protein of toxin-antitoxin system [Micromonospora olivasterospora]